MWFSSNYDKIENKLKDTQTKNEKNRVAAVADQKGYDEWRDGFTPNKGPVVSLNQKRAIPDGYTFNYGNLETSIKDTHDTAEAARSAAVAAQEAADAWRKGSTPNSGPVLSLHQRSNPVDADTYATHFGKLEDSLKATSDAAWATQNAAVGNQESIDAWRKGSTPNSGPVVLNQHRAIPDGYTFNYGNLETSIKDTHDAAEAARSAAVAAQEAADSWRKGSTPNSGPVLSLHQRSKPADADTYATHFGDLEGSLKATSDAAWAGR
jgi:hypothetical protein